MTGPAERAEDPSKWRSPRLGYSDVQQRYGWTDTDYDTARACGFPDPLSPRLGRKHLSWRVEDITAWEDRIAQLTARLPKSKR